MFNIILIAPPGAGKSVQATKLSQDPEFKNQYEFLTHLSTGDILRHEMKIGSDIGKIVTETINSGSLVSDEIVSQLVMNKILSRGTLCAGYVFDGYPRNVKQAEYLNFLFERIGAEVTAVINIKAPDSVLIPRIQERAKNSGRAEDQKEEIIKKRLKIYYKQIEPVLSYYKDILFEVDGVGTIEEVYDKIVESVTGIID